MYYVEFIYNEYKRKVECNYDETMRSICKRYTRKAILDINALHFLYFGKDINLELNFSQTANMMDKNRKIMTIDVVDRYLGDLNIVRAKELICPECYDSALLDIRKYEIQIHDCINGHNSGIVLLDEFEESQMIDLTQIKCEKCKIYSRGYTYKNEFYRCNNCKMNLCPICEMKHDKGHRIVEYDRRNYICEEHNKSYHSYCKNCNKNMCVLCEKEHEEHEIIYLHKMIKSDKKELMEKAKRIKNAVNLFVKDIKMIINKLNLVKENMKSFYELNYNIIYNYDEKNINYQVLKNIDEIRKSEIFLEVLDLINNEKDIYKKFQYSYDLYSKMIYKSEINIIYKVNKLQEDLKIFGEDFVKINKGRCKLIVDNKEQNLTSHISVKDYLKDKIKIKLQDIHKITDMSYIFNECYNLYSCYDISKWKTTRIKDMHKIFYGCRQLISLPDISFWNTSQVTDMCGMFYDCNSLTSIPDISEWEISNVTNISGLFCGCEKIKSLPDLSRWDTSKVTDMNAIFCGCSALEKIPNIDGWYTKKVKNMSGLFCGCSSLIKLPDISKWNINKVQDLSGMFFSCSKLLNFPDISDWNTSGVKSMSGMFAECSASSSLPDISKWKLNKNVELNNMFKGIPEYIDIPEKFILQN